MATVNFQCGHCHNLMAVGQESLGQQVRCPHCQQVVLAPAPSSPPSEPLTFEVPRHDEQDSIFTPPDTTGDDLFGAATPPRIEFPPTEEIPPTDLAFPRLALDESMLPPEAAPPDPPRLPLVEQPTVTYPGPEPAVSAALTETAPPVDEAPFLAPGPFTTADEAPPGPAEEELPQLAVVPRPRVARSSPWVIPLVIAPLAFYSLMATLYILDLKFLHFFTPPPPPHPLEMVPDLEGDKKDGATRGGKHGSVEFKMPDPDQALPPQLRVGLGVTLVVGDLEVTPVKVQRAEHSWTGVRDPVRFSDTKGAVVDVLELTLRLRNRSGDVTFSPTDRYFARSWSHKPGELKPYTFLEMGKHRFYGGPLDWSNKNERIDGKDYNEELKPGKEMTTFFCTNPYDDVVGALETYRGPLLWRVQLRRGLVRWTTRGGDEREDSATAVIGVEFTAADVKKAAG